MLLSCCFAVLFGGYCILVVAVAVVVDGGCSLADIVSVSFFHSLQFFFLFVPFTKHLFISIYISIVLIVTLHCFLYIENKKKTMQQQQ